MEFPNLRTMAMAYAELIAGHQTRETTVRLLGFSLGGLVALEVSRVLEERGRPVAFVGLIDCDPAWGGAFEDRASMFAALSGDLLGYLQRRSLVSTADARRFLDEAPALVRGLAVADAGDPAGVVTEWIVTRGYARDGSTRARLAEYIVRVATHIRLIGHDRRPDRTTARLVAWIAADGPVSLAGRPGDVTPAERYVLPTDHFGIVTPPHSLTIAERLRELVWTGVGGDRSGDEGAPALGVTAGTEP